MLLLLCCFAKLEIIAPRQAAAELHVCTFQGRWQIIRDFVLNNPFIIYVCMYKEIAKFVIIFIVVKFSNLTITVISRLEDLKRVPTPTTHCLSPFNHCRPCHLLLLSLLLSLSSVVVVVVVAML